MLDAAHAAVLEAFGLPERDRYQSVYEHDASRMVVQHTGLGIDRTPAVVVIRVTTRPRTREQKVAFFRILTENLQAVCGISPSDVVVSLVGNEDSDWSFGNGRAQFLT